MASTSVGHAKMKNNVVPKQMWGCNFRRICNFTNPKGITIIVVIIIVNIFI